MARNFNNDLEASHQSESLSVWGDIYRHFFPTLLGTELHTNDMQKQLAGIDRTIILANGERVHVDEKVRARAYDDILVEFIRNDNSGAPGWVCDSTKETDWIVYMFVHTQDCYAINFKALQHMWNIGAERLIKRFGIVTAENPTYKTLSCAIPFAFLQKVLGPENFKFCPGTMDAKTRLAQMWSNVREHSV